MPSDDEILTVKELCDLLRPPSTVYKLVRQGKIPSFRIGTELRFRKDVIVHWMTQRSTETQQVRKVIDSGIDGGVRHRRRATLRGHAVRVFGNA
jgi:excisionase family DNA binding protein